MIHKFLGTMYGVAIGDALGMPFEKMDACEIRNHVGKIRKFESPALNPHPFSNLKGLSSGSWTDDTQLSLATMEALIESGGKFDMDTIAKWHVQAYKGSKRGWGRSTRESCERLLNGVSWRESGQPKGAGNGVMMKIAPLALSKSIELEDLRVYVDNCVEFAKMTHLATPAIVAGVIHAVLITTLANHPSESVHVPTILHFLLNLAEHLEKELPPWKDKISSQILNIANFIDYGRSGKLGEQGPEQIAALFGGNPFYVYNSFGLSYAMFFRSLCNPDNPDPFRVVEETVEAGGDTDTNASMVGALVGALYGIEVIPGELVALVEKSAMIRERTHKLYEVCLAKSKGGYLQK